MSQIDKYFDNNSNIGINLLKEEKRIRAFSIVIMVLFFIVVSFFIAFSMIWHEPKYGISRDTFDHFGRDAEYAISRVSPNPLTNQASNNIIEPMVYKYRYSMGKLFVEGSEGYTVVEISNNNVKKYKDKSDMPNGILKTFENKKFKLVY